MPIGRGAIIEGEKGKYSVGIPAGAGGVGTVFQALSVSGGAYVAVKALHGGRFDLSDVFKARLIREFEALRRIDHPCVVKALDIGTHDGEPFLIMEWIKGGMTLQSAIVAEDVSRAQSVAWIADLLGAFKALREAGVVHRDIKPNNILIRDGRAVLVDFGTANTIARNDYLTVAGDQIGSLLYISRRQRESPADADHRDDFYSLARVMWEIATGRRAHHQSDPLKYLRPDRVPPELWDLIDDAMQDRPDWERILADLEAAIDLPNRCLADSGLEPSRARAGALIEGKLSTARKAMEARAARVGPVGVSGGEADPVLRDAATAVLEGFRRGARVCSAYGISMEISEEITDDNALYIGPTLSPELWSLVEAAGADEEWTHGRIYAWVCFWVVDAGAVELAVDGKRLYPVVEVLPLGWDEFRFLTVDESVRAWLEKFGERLALAGALGAIEKYQEIGEDVGEE